MNRIALIFIVVLLHVTCRQDRNIYAVNYTAVAAGRCKSDTLNTYHYVRPVRHKGSLPLLIILDSGGNGLMAVGKIQPAVKKIPCLVVGSDLIRNNFQGYVQAIDMLISEFSKKYPVSQVYLAGFSGGARMAFEYARTHPVQGVLMCGAGPSVNSNEKMPCPVYMIAGTSDFNFSETYYNPLKRSGQPKLVSGYFRGSHEWPPADMLYDGILFLTGKSVSGGDVLLREESARLSGKTDSILAQKENFFALKGVELALQFDPQNKMAAKHWDEFQNKPVYQADLSKLESDLMLESRINQSYAEASMKRDSLWWFNELKQLSAEIESNTGEEKDHYLRIRAFLGILFYSRLNALIHSEPGNSQIIHILAVYRHAEPENPDVYYNYALYFLKQGKEQKTVMYLKRAMSLGFKDQAKLMDEYPSTLLGKFHTESSR
jgi:pimeloyl-ACP methyl ester carboxylesterase